MKTIQRVLSCLLLAAYLMSCGNGDTGNSKGQAKTKADTGSMASGSNPVIAPKAEFDTLHDGDFIMRYKNGVIRMKGFYMGGKREGEWVSFFESGKVQSEGFFKSGMRDGRGVVYYENGKKMYDGMYKDGKMVGKWKYFNPDGTLNKEIDYSQASDKK